MGNSQFSNYLNGKTDSSAPTARNYRDVTPEEFDFRIQMTAMSREDMISHIRELRSTIEEFGIRFDEVRKVMADLRKQLDGPADATEPSERGKDADA